MKLIKLILLSSLAISTQAFAFKSINDSKTRFTLSNPFAGHLDITLLGSQVKKPDDVTLKLQLIKRYEINQPDPAGNGDSRDNAKTHRLCAVIDTVDVTITDANKKPIYASSINLPKPGQKPLITEIKLANLYKFASPINLSFSCTPYLAD